MLELLWRRGFPGVLGAAAAPLPAAIVWVDDPDDAALQLLPRVFGGHLMRELRDHHGEPTPAFWLGAGRGATLASLALARWRDSSGAGASPLLGAEAPAIWRDFEELCEALLRSERGAPAPEAATGAELAAAAAALDARVERALPIAPHVASGLALSLAGALREAERGGVAHLLPAAGERARWVDAFLERLHWPG